MMSPKHKKQERLKKEKELFKNGDPIPQPGREELLTEEKEIAPYFIFTITDAENNVVRKLYKKASKGLQKTNWDLRYQGKNPPRLKNDKFDPEKDGRSGMYALPGTYFVSLTMNHNGEIAELAGTVKFLAKPLNNTTLPAADREALVEYQNKVTELSRTMRGTENYMEELMKKTEHIRQALHNTPGAPADLAQRAKKISEGLKAVEFIFNGTKAQASWEEVPPETVPLNHRLNTIAYSHWGSTAAPTQSQLRDYEILMEEFPPVLEKIKTLDTEVNLIETEMEKYEAPWTPGRLPELKRN